MEAEVIDVAEFGPDGLALAAKGWPVFPCQLVDDKDRVVSLEDATPEMKLKKVPIGTLVERGFKEATTNAKRITLWGRVAPEALVGVAMPPNTVALDVDELERFAEAGLEMPEAPTQQTLRGGYHKLFKTDGRRVRQTVKEIPGADTRVGGLGYIVAWDPSAFPEVADLPDAPEWLYSTDSDDPRTPPATPDGPISIRRVRKTVEVATFKVGERDNALARFAGMMRREGAGPDAIYAAMKAMLENGQIESPREDPITDKDLRRIAGSIGTKESATVTKQRRVPPAYHKATDLMQKKLRPLEYPITDILPEGLGIVAGAPKVGKSWLTLQAAVAIATGTTLLGKQADKPRPVLYYGLEDGERRFQKRIAALTDPTTDLSLLAFHYESPAIGEGLEDDIAAFMDTNGEDSVVFIDVLAKIRPPAKGRGSAYDEDYGVIGPLQTLSKNHPGSSLIVVTHDRKMGSEDFLTTVTGTRGVTGAADWIWVVKRPRLEDIGNIYVTGRDIERDVMITAKFEGAWSLVGRQAPTSLTTAAKRVWDAVEANKPADLNTVADEIYGDVTQDPHRQTHVTQIWKIVSGLEAKGYVKKINATKPFLYVTFTDDDLVSGKATGVTATITRVSRARGGAPGRGTGGEDAEDSEDDESIQSSPSSRVVLPRAGARTRVRAEEAVDDPEIDDAGVQELSADVRRTNSKERDLR
jgi:hypothetical protein